MLHSLRLFSSAWVVALSACAPSANVPPPAVRYPELLQQAGIQGPVRFRVQLDSAGSPQHHVPDRRNTESGIPTCSAHCSKRLARFKQGWSHCRADGPLYSNGHGRYRFSRSLSEQRERLDRLRSWRANNHAPGLLMGSWSRAPVCYTERPPRTRLVTARSATRRERIQYEEGQTED